MSTGTWCISINPFNNTDLTDFELGNDTLCYLNSESIPVKASRFLGGKIHEEGCKKISIHFNVKENFYKSLPYPSDGSELNAAYDKLMNDLLLKQKQSTGLILKNSFVKKIICLTFVFAP